MPPVIAVIMGSESDRMFMEKCVRELEEKQIPHDVFVMSAHRDPERVREFAQNARANGYKVIIAGAGMAAALPGVIAAQTDLPVIGVPIAGTSNPLRGQDALYAIVQMPPGVPVACMAINGAKNAALFAMRILGVN